MKNNRCTREATMRPPPKQEWFYRWRLFFPPHLFWFFFFHYFCIWLGSVSDSHAGYLCWYELGNVLTHQLDRHLLLCVRRNIMSTARATKWPPGGHQTIWNRLHESGLMGRCPLVDPVLTAWKHRAWLIFAIEYQNYQVHHWHPVPFTQIHPRDTDEKAWSSRGKHYTASNIVQHDWFGGRSDIVWGAISSTGNGTMTAIWCWDETFGPHRPYNGAVCTGFLLLHDNAWPHVVRVCRQFLGGWKNWYYWLPAMLTKSNRTPLGHRVSVHPTPPGCTSDCPGAQWCRGPDKDFRVSLNSALCRLIILISFKRCVIFWFLITRSIWFSFPLRYFVYFKVFLLSTPAAQLLVMTILGIILQAWGYWKINKETRVSLFLCQTSKTVRVLSIFSSLQEYICTFPK